MHILLTNYIDNSWKNKGNEYVANIFEVERKGESEQIKSYRDTSNNKLLFHGSSIQNYLGIFYEGMQIKHSESRGSGLMGEGLYFADRFEKARGYAQNSAY